jgi:hypothetical protein
LADLHPQGRLNHYISDTPGRDFYYYLVPPAESIPIPEAPSSS